MGHLIYLQISESPKGSSRKTMGSFPSCVSGRSVSYNQVPQQSQRAPFHAEDHQPYFKARLYFRAFESLQGFRQCRCL